MTTPQPLDPLDEPIARFVASVKNFLFMALEASDFESPAEVSRSGNPFLDIKNSWDELKRRLGKLHEVLVGAEPEVDERLQVILSTGTEVIGLTEDPYIVGPVQGLVRMAAEHRADIANIITRLGNATSLPNVLVLFGEMVGINPRIQTRLQEIGNQLDALTAYYLLQLPPNESA